MKSSLVNQMIQEHSQGAFAMAMNMLKCRDDAQDVIQDALYSLLKQPRLPSESNQFRMLLFKVVRNKVIDRIRAKKKRKAEVLEEEHSPSCGHHEPDNQYEQALMKTQLQQALTALSAEHRDIILLKDWQGFCYADIANILGIEPGTVMSRLHRARLALRNLLQQGDDK
ncbi:RNA polymerase sigma factor [Pleionea sediminis]|uniref:RNA polymerase sigma factor n=1 Tax=Pleionea sediminis TaxID=2569479 RepID=UPI0011863BB6|nr:RNA polymerase sigma factor [Pleionea sediminis]